MFRKIVSSIILACAMNAVYADQVTPNFVFLPNPALLSIFKSPQAVEKIQQASKQLINSVLHVSASSPYRTLRVRTIVGEKAEIKALIVYLLSKQNKSFQVVRLNVNPDFSLTSMQADYQVQLADLRQSPGYDPDFKPTCPNANVQFVIGNNFTGDASVEAEVQKVYALTKAKGYQPFLMDVNKPKGPQPTVQAYQNWLSCPKVKGFYNESHGSESSILLSDNDFTYTLMDKELKNKLRHAVILFDSCVTFHDPLLSAMTSASKGNSQQYIAGLIYLPFGASERTATCFWTQAVKGAELNATMLADCSKQNGLDPKGFGIAGNGDNHLKAAR